MPKLVHVCLNEQSTPTLCLLGDVELEINDFCVIKNQEGLPETGYVRSFPHFCERQCAGREFPSVERRATSRDVQTWHSLKLREAEALVVCKEMALKHKLDMKISLVRFDDRLHKVSFHFTADKRVDFRELVKELAARFRARIELWQVGVRDEAKTLGGLGGCGRQMCCSSWMREFIPVSIRYAKSQDIQFSPSKLSGVCGRLRCCLAYEQDQYVEMSKGVPPVGAAVRFGDSGEGKVLDRNLLSGTLSLAFGEGRATAVSIDELNISQQRNPDAEKTGKKQTVWVLERIASPEPEPMQFSPSAPTQRPETWTSATTNDAEKEKKDGRRPSRPKQRQGRGAGQRPERKKENNEENNGVDTETAKSKTGKPQDKEKQQAGRGRRRSRGRSAGGATQESQTTSTPGGGQKKNRSQQRSPENEKTGENAQSRKKGQNRRQNQKSPRPPRPPRPDSDSS